MRAHRTLLICALTLLPTLSHAEEKKEKKIRVVNTLVMNEESDMAIMGYDTVAFFTQHKAIRGNREIRYTWKDAIWLFASKQDMELFQASPDKYAPQYGGFCAYGMANGLRVSTNGIYWNIVDDKLYLHNNAGVQNTWLKDFDGFIRVGDRKYEEFVKESSGEGKKEKE